MTEQTLPLLLTQRDYELIMRNLHTAGINCTPAEKDELKTELKKARLVDEMGIPPQVVRLNSTVTIRDEAAGRTQAYTIVVPERADIRAGKISVLSPVGTALIGYSKGQRVQWKVPSGQRTFTIIDVVPPLASSNA